MYWFKASRVIYVVWVLLLLCSFSFVSTNAYEYQIWVSRSVVWASDPKIVGTWGQSYSAEYFTGLWYCTWYYYLNHKKVTAANPIWLVRQVLWYDSGAISMSLSYLNFGLAAWVYPWETAGVWWYQNFSWKDLYVYNLTLKGWQTTAIPYVYTIWRFWIINRTNIAQVTITWNYSSTPAIPQSTFISHDNNTNFYTGADTWYNFTVKYYAQPCIPDTPILSSYITKINWNADGQYTLATIPAFDITTTSSTVAGRPETIGTDLTDTAYHIPWTHNIWWTFQKHISFDSGILLWIKEPSISSNPPYSALAQSYSYTSWSPRYSWFILVDWDYGVATSGTSNQRWINPDTISVRISFTGVDKNNYADAGVFCDFTITWDTNLWLSGIWYSWNMNRLWYSINVSSTTIRTLAKQKCLSEFAYITTTWDLDLKRETVANISWNARDYANSMLITQSGNDVTYAWANQIAGTTGYLFNSYSWNPVLSMATDNTLLGWSLVYNIPVTNSSLRFTGTDVYAGINSGTFLIIVSGYESSITRSDNRRNSWTPDHSFVFSGNDVSKFPFRASSNDRDDYTWFINFAGLSATTGMYFTVSLKATDFVGNSTTQNYSFKTPTWPNAPHGSPATISAQTKTPITQINLISNITEDSTADGWWSYDYTTYYPSSSGLIADFSYMSWWSYLTADVNIQITVWSVLLTWLIFHYSGANSYVDGTPYVSSGWQAMTGYTATTFSFQVLATNVYGITWVLTYNINVQPSCTESAWCTDPVYIFRWTNLSEAMAQETAARLSGDLLASHRYPHWFAQIKQSGPNFYFSGNGSTEILYCANTGNSLLINYWWYNGPQNWSPMNYPSATDFTGDTLTISGWTVLQFGVYTATVTADYVTVPDNWQDKMTIYINRPLTGRVFYSVCEFTGWITLDPFGCYVTGDINWTKLTVSDTFTITGWVEWWWLTWNRAGYVTGWSINNWDQFSFWSTGTVYAGWWYRTYTKTLSGDVQENINTSGNVTFAVENRTGATTNFGYEIYRIDNAGPQVTWATSIDVQNRSMILTLTGSNTWQLANSQTSNLTWDDEYKITSFSGVTVPQLYETTYGSTIHTWGRYINGGDNIYKMIHTMTFADNRTGDICIQDRAGNESCIYVEVSGIWNKVPMTITVRPAFRPDPASNTTWYSIIDWDFWFRINSGGQWISRYNSSAWTDPKVTTSKYGTGEVSILTPDSGTVYLVVFKWSWTLSAGFTGVRNSSITEFNFFTWAFADNFSNDFVYEFYNTGTLMSEYYLKVWDVMSYDVYTYDYVGTEDFSAILDYLTMWIPNHPHRYDFDLNNVISSMEQSMVLQARNQHGYISWLESGSILPMTGFVTF